MFCNKCGKEFADGVRFCPHCGNDLGTKTTVVADAGMGSWIPRNSYALWAYYLGIASLLLCFLTGVPALITGILGVRYANVHPEAKGKVHAWVGIVIGALSIILPVVVFLHAQSR